METGLSPGGLDARSVAVLCTDLAFVDAPDDRVREVMGAHFRTHVPEIKSDAERETIALARNSVRARIASNQRADRALEPLITVASNTEVCEPHWVKKVAGKGLGIVGITMLLPIPVVVAAGMAESDAIAMVADEPLTGLLYGIAPIGAALSVHGLKECFRSNSVRKAFDLLIYGGALASAGAWAMLFGPTFLADAASGFGAAAESEAVLSTWYTAQLAMEFFGGAACLTAAVNLLTVASSPVSTPNPSKNALQEAIAADTAEDRALAAREDALAPNEGAYDAACSAFETRCVVHVESARKLLAMQAATDANTALAAVRNTLITTIKEGEQYA